MSRIDSGCLVLGVAGDADDFHAINMKCGEPAAHTPALDDGLVPSDWYALLSGFVFL